MTGKCGFQANLLSCKSGKSGTEAGGELVEWNRLPSVVEPAVGPKLTRVGPV